MGRRDFPGGPAVKILCSKCRGHKFNPWLGKIPHHVVWHPPKKADDICPIGAIQGK